MSATEFDDLVASELEGYDEDGLRELVERAFQIQELTRHPAWPLYIDLIVARTVTKQRVLLSGQCRTLEEYAKLAGWIQGAQAAIDAPARLQERLDDARARFEELNSPTEGEEDE